MKSRLETLEIKPMTKRTIEIDDVLPGCVENAIEETERLLRGYLADNPDIDEPPCLSNDLDYDGRFHEIIDGCVPIWTSQIEAAWFLHGRALEMAYENAGVGDNPRENGGMAAIYYYIYEKAAEWYQRNVDRIFDQVRNS
jgi:hypothetical protein